MYAHFGREQDFKKLEELGVSVKGKIVLARYGEVFRANIVSDFSFVLCDEWE